MGNKLLFMLLISLSFAATFASAATINVNTSGYDVSGVFVSSVNPLTAAVSIAQDGDVVNVSAGNYSTHLFINKSITLQGLSPNNTEIQLPIDAHSLSGNPNSYKSGILVYTIGYESPTTQATIRNIAINGMGRNLTNTAGIFVYAANATIDNVRVANFYTGNETAIFYDDSGTTSSEGIFVNRPWQNPMNINVTIKNSNILYYLNDGVTAAWSGTRITLQNTSIYGFGTAANFTQYGVALSQGATGSIDESTIAFNQGEIINNGTANLSADSSAIYIYSNGTEPFIVRNTTFVNNSNVATLSANDGQAMPSLLMSRNRFLNYDFALRTDAVLKNTKQPFIDVTNNYWGFKSPNFTYSLNGFNISQIENFTWYKDYNMTLLNTEPDFVSEIISQPAPPVFGGSGGGGSGSTAASGGTQQPAQQNSNKRRDKRDISPGLPDFWDITIPLLDRELSSGVNQHLKENQRVVFSISSDTNTHILGVMYVGTAMATIYLASKPISLNISIGEESRFDLNEDCVYDVYIKLNDIINGGADVSLKSISEDYCKDDIYTRSNDIEPTKVNGEEKSKNSFITGAAIGSTVKRYWLPSSIFIVLVIGAWVVVRARKLRSLNQNGG